MTAVADASLVVTVLNEGRTVGGLLRSLASQDLLPAEIVMVDGGSTDETAAEVARWEPPVGVEFRWVVRPGVSIAQGRNTAIAMTTHNRILVTDGGSTLDPGWVRALVAALDGGAHVASGFFRPLGSTRLQQIIGAVITPTVDEIDPARFLPSSRSVGFEKTALVRAGMYPEWLDYCEDLVLDLALAQAGARFVFVPQAVATWDARPDLASFARQYYRYARGDAQAGLWPLRHALRFTAYLIGALALVRGPALPIWARAAVLLGAAGHLSQGVHRIHKHAATMAVPRGLGTAMAPVVTVIGDIAKMAGYLAGHLRGGRR